MSACPASETCSLRLGMVHDSTQLSPTQDRAFRSYGILRALEYQIPTGYITDID